MEQSNRSTSSEGTITGDTEVPRRSSVPGYGNRDPYVVLRASEPPSAELTQSISSQAAAYMVSTITIVTSNWRLTSANFRVSICFACSTKIEAM